MEGLKCACKVHIEQFVQIIGITMMLLLFADNYISLQQVRYGSTSKYDIAT